MQHQREEPWVKEFHDLWDKIHSPGYSTWSKEKNRLVHPSVVMLNFFKGVIALKRLEWEKSTD